MRISDWSSDVCSSDLTGLGFVQVGGARFDMLARADQSCVRGGQRLSHPDEGDGDAVDRGGDGAVDRRVAAGDRKSVEEGKTVSVRVDLGGRRIIKNKK